MHTVPPSLFDEEDGAYTPAARQRIITLQATTFRERAARVWQVSRTLEKLRARAARATGPFPEAARAALAFDIAQTRRELFSHIRSLLAEAGDVVVAAIGDEGVGNDREDTGLSSRQLECLVSALEYITELEDQTFRPAR